MMPDSFEPIPEPQRRRLSYRRCCETSTLIIDKIEVTATVGFDETGAPREIFLNAGKEGTAISNLLADAAVAISVALQHGVAPAALAKSIGRIPVTWNGPARDPASAIGGALDLLVQCQAGAG